MTTGAALDPTTPVLVGVGLVSQREQDPTVAREPIELMIDAARAAAADAGVPALTSAIDRILVPVGRWRYGDPGAMIGAAMGSPAAHTVSALPGVSQQTLLSDAAGAIAAGDITTALVVGGEAGHRLLQARIAGMELTDTENAGDPDVILRPHDPVIPAHERERGLGVMPVGYYALIDSSWRHAHGRSIDEHRDQVAARYHRFSSIAAANPHGWDDSVVDRAAIRDARMMAFPYTKHHVSNWNVDQATALLLTSAAEAERLGIPRPSWIFPQAFTESNDMVDVSARGVLHRCVGAELAAVAALDAAACGPDDLHLVELYSCFPVAVEVHAEALGLTDRVDWSFTGAMPFGGGPFNNFVLHATAQLAHHLRATPGRRGLISTVSGILTKHGFAIWGTEPNPAGYRFVDVTEAARSASDVRLIDPAHTGPGTVAGYTVVHGRGGPEAGVVVVDLPDRRRTVAFTTDPGVMADMEATEYCGREVTVIDDRFDPGPGTAGAAP